jgi:hypothetical protein
VTIHDRAGTISASSPTSRMAAAAYGKRCAQQASAHAMRVPIQSDEPAQFRATHDNDPGLALMNTKEDETARRSAR